MARLAQTALLVVLPACLLAAPAAAAPVSYRAAISGSAQVTASRSVPQQEGDCNFNRLRGGPVAYTFASPKGARTPNVKVSEGGTFQIPVEVGVRGNFRDETELTDGVEGCSDGKLLKSQSCSTGSHKIKTSVEIRLTGRTATLVTRGENLLARAKCGQFGALAPFLPQPPSTGTLGANIGASTIKSRGRVRIDGDAVSGNVRWTLRLDKTD